MLAAWQLHSREEFVLQTAKLVLGDAIPCLLLPCLLLACLDLGLLDSLLEVLLPLGLTIEHAVDGGLFVGGGLAEARAEGEDCCTAVGRTNGNRRATLVRRKGGEGDIGDLQVKVRVLN